MAGWRQWVSSVGPVELASSIHRSYSFTAMSSTSMIAPHIFSDTTTSTHLSLRPVNTPTTRQMIVGPTSSWRDITAYQHWNGRESMEPWNLLLTTWIMFLWRCGIFFNKNQPLSSFTPLKSQAPAPLPTWSRHRHPSMSSINPNTTDNEIRRNRRDC